MATNLCKKCNKEVVTSSKSDNSLKCSFCLNIWHNVCLNIASGVCKYVMSTPNCIWSCDSCSGGNGVLQQILHQINLLTSKMCELEQRLISAEQTQTIMSSGKLNELETRLNQLQHTQISANISDSLSPKRKNRKNNLQQSWAEIVGSGNVTPLSSSVRTLNQIVKKPPVLVVKPRDEKSNVNIHDVVKKFINPLNDPFTAMRKTKSNKVVIQCEDEAAINSMKQKLNEKIGDQVKIDSAKAAKPRIKIVGIHDFESNENLIQYLCKQNPKEIITADSLKVIYVKQLPTYTTAIVQLDYDTFKRVMQKKRLNVKFDSCRVYEHIDPHRCYKCNGFGHSADVCESNTHVCPKCSGPHKIKDCDSDQIICVNCKNANVNRNLNLPTNHFTWSQSCPILQRRVKSIKKIVDYEK